MKIAAVFHGEADKAVLSDAAYVARFKVAANPNLPLIRNLKKAGVDQFFVLPPASTICQGAWFLWRLS